MNLAAREAIQLSVETIGSRWRQHVLATVQRRMPAQRWVRLAQAIQDKHLLPQVGLADVAAGKLAEADPAEGRPVRFPPASDRLNWPQTQPGASQPGSQTRTPQADDALTGGPATAPVPQLNSNADLAGSGLPPAVERAGQVRLEARAQDFLAGLLDIHIPAVKLYVNQAADEVAKSYHADALTYGDKILVRRDKYNPRDPAGLGLLGHELTHAAQARMGNPSPSGPRSQSGRDRQEAEALHNEQRVLHHFSGSQPLPQFSAPPALALRGAALPSRPPAALPPGQPLAAASDRDDLPPALPAGAMAAPQLSDQQLQQIYRYIKRRLDDEFNGGG